LRESAVTTFLRNNQLARFIEEAANWGGHLRTVAQMGRQVAIALYVAAMAAVIVGVDVVFFRDRFWERLMANIGIVLVFAAFYLRFLGRR
jgi:hypothetical protein